MPSWEQLRDWVFPEVRRNLVWLNYRFRFGLSDRDVSGDARDLSDEILARLRKGCECARDLAPPTRSTETNYWAAVRRCETDHQITLRDLARAGDLPANAVLARSLRGIGTQFPLVGTACDTVIQRGNDQFSVIADAMRAELEDREPPHWSYTSDDRFWHFQTPRGAWRLVVDHDLASIAPGTTLRGRYLGCVVTATWVGEGQLTTSWDRVTYDSFGTAAAAARHHIVNEIRPHRPWWDWEANGHPLERIRHQFWERLFQTDFQDPQWKEQSCRTWGGHPMALRRFVTYAAVGGRLPVRARDFSRSVFFFEFRDRRHRCLRAGQVLMCHSCHWETDGHGCTHDECDLFGSTPVALANPMLNVFPERTRIARPAHRCTRDGCGHFWIDRAHPAPCPRCGGAAATDPTTVWVEDD